jgi:hypothetical protein
MTVLMKGMLIHFLILSYFNPVNTVLSDYSCVKDRVHRLCKDCDVVFHKSAIKRRHIRLPVILIKSLRHSSNILPDVESEQLPSEVFCFSLNELVSNSSTTAGDIIDYIGSFSASEAVSRLELRDAVSCLLTNTVIGLIDDRKVT